MRNLFIIDSINHHVIASSLLKLTSGRPANFTNGTYALEERLVVTTSLAGFKYISLLGDNLPFVIAVNSDKSMRALNKEGFEPQEVRARKAAEPVAALFPDRPVIVIYYDEKTPEPLYVVLQAYGLLNTHHKWGYGTKKTEPKIEGAQCFRMVFGLPLPDDTKPVCYNDTPVADEPQNVIVIDLRCWLINDKRELLFDVPVSLERHVAPSHLTRQTVSYSAGQHSLYSPFRPILYSAPAWQSRIPHPDMQPYYPGYTSLGEAFKPQPCLDTLMAVDYRHV